MHPLLCAATALAGLLLALGGAQAFFDSLRGPVAESDLRFAGGPLASVSPCSSGRNARFNYLVQAAEGPVEASMACPSPMQRELAGRVGQTVLLKYRSKRNLGFVPGIVVYEFRIDNGALWSVAEINAQLRSTRWLKLPLALLASIAGLFIAGLGLREWRKARATAR